MSLLTDRATDFFCAKVMTLAMRGLEGLIRNQGRMRLIIGCTFVSSHLMRRRDRARELIEDAQPYDLIILDEAHHAFGEVQEEGSKKDPISSYP